MHGCSEQIGKFAAALTRAQSQMANPEKTFTATIRSPFPREAPASDGAQEKSIARFQQINPLNFGR
ncbi:hypothetical protein IVB30_10605 [Bradyrhizobium sp. 200]|uniref:hypothetical protein n=1 Tax=Bradyrhizobium sp. 200 TaxID=2782665 RepID=UPI001FFEB39F|nr:hypothetical protein [Bradyrhizobium sp. 200]UPJ51751.1 hypothetical protein IVB30_10605 [Bradyrhizobium sp. 200]